MNKNDLFWDRQRNYYESLKYDSKTKYMSWQPAKWASNVAAAQRLFKDIGINLDTTFELGAGSCAFSYCLHHVFNNCLKAIDLSQSAVEFGNQIGKDLNIDVDYTYGDFYNLKTDNCADMVLSIGVIEHFNDKEQDEFIKLCERLTRKYVLIAIPNQTSWIFTQYVDWSNKNNDKYEEKHEPLDINKLISKVENNNLKILYVDGFHTFLSEKKFWNEVDFSSYSLVEKQKELLTLEDKIRYDKFPYIDFHLNDIEHLSKVENLLSNKTRIEEGFMNYVLAEKREIYIKSV